MHLKTLETNILSEGSHYKDQQNTTPKQSDPMVENEGSADMTSSENNTTNIIVEEPVNIIKQYHGREWSEVAHILQVPETEDGEEEDWSSAVSEISSDSHDDPFAEDIHELVNVLDNIVRSQSNLNCDATRVVEYLDLDLFKYEAMLAEIERWDFDSEVYYRDDSSVSSADFDAIDT